MPVVSSSSRRLSHAFRSRSAPKSRPLERYSTDSFELLQIDLYQLCLTMVIFLIIENVCGRIGSRFARSLELTACIRGRFVAQGEQLKSLLSSAITDALPCAALDLLPRSPLSRSRHRLGPLPSLLVRARRHDSPTTLLSL